MREIISLAPGRICIFGDYHDYLELPVIACAINRNITLNCVQNNIKVFRLNMVDITQVRIIDINEIFSNLEPRDYFAPSLRVLRRHKCIPNVCYNITVNGNIPINSGASSSFALLLARINFLITPYGVDEPITPDFIARIGYESEVLENGEPEGLMDYYSIGIKNIIHINTDEPFSCSVKGNQLNGLITRVSGIPKEAIGLSGELKTNALIAILMVKKIFHILN